MNFFYWLDVLSTLQNSLLGLIVGMLFISTTVFGLPFYHLNENQNVTSLTLKVVKHFDRWLIFYAVLVFVLELILHELISRNHYLCTPWGLRLGSAGALMTLVVSLYGAKNKWILLLSANQSETEVKQPLDSILKRQKNMYRLSQIGAWLTVGILLCNIFSPLRFALEKC